MKKVMLSLMCAVMLACLAACGTEETPKGSGSAISGEVKIPTINQTVTAASEESKLPIINNNITDSSDMMEIESPVGKLYYPIKWKDDVTFTTADGRVDAMFEGTPLFTIYFGGDQGDVFGTVEQNGAEVTLRYELYELDAKGEQFETMSAMQDDINVIFYYLTQVG